MKLTYTNRKYIVYSIFIIVGLILIIRLFYLQIINQSYKLYASNNVLRYITEYPSRGLIVDRNGKILVCNEAAYDLMVTPRYAKNIDTLELCRLIGITKEEFISKLDKARNYSVYKASIFEKQLSKETFGFLQEKLHKFPGFYVQVRTLRKYPYKMAAHTFGYVGEVNLETTKKDQYYKMGDYIGISSLEQYYEKELRGKKGLRIMMVDVHNRDKASYQNGRFDTASVAGSNLYTSLDAELQEYGEKLMTNKIGSIVAIEPSSGEILALVSSPSYDPNLLVGRVRTKNFSELSQNQLKPLFNRALMAQYPPGSTFKLINALIGLNDGVLKPETRYPCYMGYHFGNINVGCHNHFSPLNLEQSIQLSCNAYYCNVFRSIIDNKEYNKTSEGFNHWRKLVLSFGFGKKFDSDLPNELPGLIPTADYYNKYFGKDRWKSLTIISLSIGQGELGITPLQLANLSAIMANRGFYYTPHIVKAIGKIDNYNSRFTEKKYINIDTSYFNIVVEGMHKVVLAGTATGARLDSVEICGKTGTAQNPHGKDHSIFIAFAPKDNPKIAISVIIENAGFGATYAAPIASLMIEKYLKRTVNRKDLELRMIESTLMP